MSMSDASAARLWITPAFDDERCCLLVWNRGREQFELPAARDSRLSRLIERAASPLAQWQPPHFPTRSLHAAWMSPDVELPSPDFEWVALRDMQIGFTHRGRTIDTALRPMLEFLGRSPRRPDVDEDWLTIGTIGHQDLPDDDIPVLFDKVHQVLEDLRAEFPHRELRVLSALTAGAHQMLADAALEQALPVFGLLPLPQACCEQSCSTPDAAAEWRETLDRTAAWCSLPVAAGTTLRDLEQPSEARQLQLAQAGRQLVDRCDVLLALWDGHASTRPGSAADLLRYAFKPYRHPAHPLMIRHIPTHRE